MNVIEFRKKYQGFLEINPKVEIKDSYSLSLVYTPGVGESSLAIKDNPEKAYELTNKANSIAIITDCSDFPDFETINPLSALPHIESKAVLYKELAGIDAYPVVVNTKDIEEIAETIVNLMPNFAGFDAEAMLPERSATLENMLRSKEIPIFWSYRSPHLFLALENTGLLNRIQSEMIVPALMRAAIDMNVTTINYEMYDAISEALKECDRQGILTDHCCNQYNYKAAAQIAFHVAKAAYDSGCARTLIDPIKVWEKYLAYAMEGSKALFKGPLLGYKSEECSLNANAVELRRKAGGVIETKSKITVRNPYDFGLFFSNAKNDQVSKEIEVDYRKAYELTSKGNTVAVVSDGSAVLGLGNIGAEAALPVMEGKAVLFKSLAGVDAVPICLATQDIDKLVDIISHITPNYGGINLEDIAAPRCFELEERLIKKLSIPVFHDDQHGTAVVVLAGVLNALRCTGKKIEDIKIVMSGAGAAAQSVAKLLIHEGAKNITLCDINGAVYKGRKQNDEYLEAMAEVTNPDNNKGDLKSLMTGADFFIGLSAGGIVTKDMIKSMNKNPVVFALANPTPEIMPDEAKVAGALIVATGRSDFENQINNSLAFPGIFRGALDTRAKLINTEMKLAAASAIADLVKDNELCLNYIIPKALDLRVTPNVARAVAKAAIQTGVAQVQIDPDVVYENTHNYIYTGIR